MFGLFLSKNQKRVKKWQKEHRQILDLVHEVNSAYLDADTVKLKKALSRLERVTVAHLMDEDVALYHLMKDEKRIDKETEAMVVEFIQSFKKTKQGLIAFLDHAVKGKLPLDDHFFATFKETMRVVLKRIDFEEKNLYEKLKRS